MGIEKAYFSAGPDGRLTIGNQIIELEDTTHRVFKTEDITSFEKMVAAATGTRETVVFYNDAALSLEFLVPAMGRGLIALCDLKESVALSLLLRHNGVEHGIADFEQMLTALRKYAVGSHLSVLSNLRNLVVAKKQTYERDLDNAGNFRLLMQRESATNDWVPPKEMVFAVPMFKFIPDLVEVRFDFHFSVKENGHPSFRLENLTAKDEILDAKRAYLEKRLADTTPCPFYWGDSQINNTSDSWKYRENKAAL